MSVLSISIVDPTSEDAPGTADVLRVTGLDAEWEVSGVDAGTVSGIAFSGIEHYGADAPFWRAARVQIEIESFGGASSPVTIASIVVRQPPQALPAPHALPTSSADRAPSRTHSRTTRSQTFMQ